MITSFSCGAGTGNPRPPASSPPRPQGTLAAGGAELRLVFHFTPDAEGGFTATLDSPDQGARGIPVASVALADSSLKVDFPQIMASYEGKVNAGVTAITGSLSQGGMAFPLNLSRPPAPSTVKRVPKPGDIDGDWEGALNAGGYSGTIDAALATIDGTWTQAGNSLPFVLKRVRR